MRAGSVALANFDSGIQARRKTKDRSKALATQDHVAERGG